MIYALLSQIFIVKIYLLFHKKNETEKQNPQTFLLFDVWGEGVIGWGGGEQARMELTRFADTTQHQQGSVWQTMSFFVKTRNLVESL